MLRRKIIINNKTEPGHEKMCLMSYANNKGADQPAHPRSLISAFVVRYLDSIIYLDSTAKLSMSCHGSTNTSPVEEGAVHWLSFTLRLY